jgi:hypothetical protein
MATIGVRSTRTRVGLVARRSLVAVVVVATAAAAVVAGPGLVDRVRTSLASSAADPVAQSEDWVSANLPVDARVVADTSVVADLVRMGTPAWQLLDFHRLDALSSLDGAAVAANWKTYDYVVSTPALRTALAPGGQTRQALAGAVVVASFGAGVGRVDVDQIETATAAEVAGRVADATAASKDAGQQLLSSTSIRLSPDAAQQAVSGYVDGRLLALLVGLGGQHTLTVGSFSDPDPGGLFANRLRQVSILVVDGTLVRDQSAQVTAVLNWLAAQTGQFRPSAVAVRGSQLLIRFRIAEPTDPAVL